MGLTIWDEVHYQTGDNALQTVLAVRRGMTANILDIVVSAYVILEGVMLAQWLKDRDQRKEREAVKEAQKATELNQQWQAWYERQQAAFREGRPFDEPPPAGPGPAPTAETAGNSPVPLRPFLEPGRAVTGAAVPLTVAGVGGRHFGGRNVGAMAEG